MIPGTFAIIAGGGSQKSLVFQESRDSTSASSSFSFSNVNFGYADPTRLVVVGVTYYEYDTSVTLNSVTVGGTTATSRKTNSISVPGGSGSFVYANISSASLATGTTGNVSVSFNRVIDRGCSIGVWALYGLQSTTPVATDSGDATSGAASMSFTTQPEDVIIAVLAGGSTAGSATWTGLTENYDSAPNALLRSGASGLILTTGSLTVTGENSAARTAIVGAQWR